MKKSNLASFKPTNEKHPSIPLPYLIHMYQPRNAGVVLCVWTIYFGSGIYLNLTWTHQQWQFLAEEAHSIWASRKHLPSYATAVHHSSCILWNGLSGSGWGQWQILWTWWWILSFHIMWEISCPLSKY